MMVSLKLLPITFSNLLTVNDRGNGGRLPPTITCPVLRLVKVPVEGARAPL